MAAVLGAAGLALAVGLAGVARAQERAAAPAAAVDAHDHDGHDHAAHDGHDHGGPAAAPEREPDPRVALEGKIDLSALRGLTVQDGGRRKPFDTFAREKVKLVLGTERFKKEDPVYTFLSLLFEPDRWRFIRALKVRNLNILRLFETGTGRVAVLDVERSEAFRAKLASIAPHDDKLGPTDNAALELNFRVRVFKEMPRYLCVLPVPGADEEAAWSNIVDLAGQTAEVRESVQALFWRTAESFRAGDAAATTKAMGELVAKLRSLQGERAVPAWKTDLEVLMNRAHPFHYSWMILVVAASLLGFAYMTQARWAYRLGIAAFAAGVGLGLFGLVARTLIVGRAPVGNLYEATIFFSFAAVATGAIFEAIHRNAIFGAAAATFGFFAFLLADLAPAMDRAIQPLQPVLVSYWLNIHVTAMLISYGAFAVAFLLGVFYYAKYFPARGLPKATIFAPAAVALSGLGYLFWRAIFDIARPLHIADYAIALVATPLLGVGVGYALVKLGKTKKIAYQDELQLKMIERHLYRVCQVGFAIITAGIILGAVWANESWGRYWDWDPKETWAFITWLAYGVFIHGRIAGWFRGPKAAIWGIIGFYCVLFTFFGVSFVLPGLHSYL